MHLPVLNINDFMAFSLILLRVSVIMAMVPIFGSYLVPNKIKIALIMTLSFFLFTIIQVDTSVFPTKIVGFIPLILSEGLIGLAIGLLIRMVFAAVLMAGQLVGYQMGLAIANILDPQTGSQVSVMAEFSYIIALLLFLALNGHYLIIKGLVESFELSPIGTFVASESALELMIANAGKMFSVAVKVGAAPFVVLFFAKISMGIIAKMVPQMNVLFVGMPLYILIGLFVTGLSISHFAPILSRAFKDVELSIMAFLKAV